MKASTDPCGAPAPYPVRGMYTPDDILRAYAGQTFCSDGLHLLVDCNSHGRCFIVTTGACPRATNASLVVNPYTFATFREADQPAAYRQAQKFCRRPADVGNLIFTGNPGLGKTHLAKAVMAECRAMNRTCEFITRAELHDTFMQAQPAHDNPGERWTATERLGKIKSADVVVFDDFGGAGPQSAFFVEAFRELLDGLEGHFVLTTNKSQAGMVRTYDDQRVISRLYQTAQHVAFVGSDQRQPNKQAAPVAAE